MKDEAAPKIRNTIFIKEDTKDTACNGAGLPGYDYPDIQNYSSPSSPLLHPASPVFQHPWARCFPPHTP